MNKEEALIVQKEILASCNGLTENAVILVLPSADGPLSHGYQVHVKSGMLKENLSCLKAIAGKHILALKESKTDVVIYRPCFVGFSSRELL